MISCSETQSRGPERTLAVIVFSDLILQMLIKCLSLAGDETSPPPCPPSLRFDLWSSAERNTHTSAFIHYWSRR